VGGSKILVWSKKIRCLELKECFAIVDLEMVVGGISYMFFYLGFKGSTNLTYVIFPTRARNLVNTGPSIGSFYL
jgi:hypothetical protein